MRRLFNIRPSLVIAVAFVLGIISFYELLFGEFWIVLIASVSAVTSIVMFAAMRNRLWRIALAATVFLAFGLLWSWLFFSVNTQDVKGDAVTLTGRVTDMGRNGSQYSSVYYLESCSDSDGNKLGGRVKVTFGYGTTLDVGDVVTVTGNIYGTYPIKGEFRSYYLRNRVRYDLLNPVVDNVTGGKMKADEKTRKYVYDVAVNYAPNNSGVIYALLTGDRNAVDDATGFVFTGAGIAHLLAVSGLHVGFIATVIGFALKRFRLRPWLECLLVTAPLLFYAYICGFAPSVMRAVIMLVCTYVARMLLSRYDMLTSLAWAAIVTLAVDPFYLFDVGFQLSFMSVFGIATLYVPLNRLLVRKNVNKHFRRLIDSVAVSACCIFATLAVLATQGGEVAVLGVLLNVLAIPAVSVAFVMCLFGLIPWVFHYLVYLADVPLQFLMRLSEKASELSFATVSFKATYIAVAVMVVLLFSVGGFVNFSKLVRKIFYPICCFCLVLSIVFAYIPRSNSNSVFVVHNEYGTAVAVLSQSGEAAIVSDFADYSTVMSAAEFLGNHRVSTLRLYFCQCANANYYAVANIVQRFDVAEARLLSTDANDEITNLVYDVGAEVVRQYPNSTYGEEIAVRNLFDGGLSAVTVRVSDIDVCFVYGNDNRVLDLGLGADVYLLSEANVNYDEVNCVTFTPYQSNLSHNYGANKYGNFTIVQKGDTIVLGFR